MKLIELVDGLFQMLKQGGTDIDVMVVGRDNDGEPVNDHMLLNVELDKESLKPIVYINIEEG